MSKKTDRHDKKGKSAEIWMRMKKNKIAMLGLAIFVIFILISIFADVIAPNYLVTKQTEDVLAGPSAEHIFGTDKVGRDVFARVIHATRISLSIGVISCVISVVVGGIFGSMAGYYGGWLDDVIMRIMDVFLCIPSTLLALAIVAALGSSMVNLIIAITIANIPGEARVVRSVILNVVGEDFIIAAESYGASDARIIAKYVMPNAVGPVIVFTTMGIAGMILTAAGLSFIGMGVQPPMPEWGFMLSEAQNYMRYAPHLIIFPGVALLLAALSFNLLGDGLQDALDPKLRD